MSLLIKNGTVVNPAKKQIERAGVHSGESMAVYPAQHLSQELIDQIVDYTRRIAVGLNVKGVLNIQYIVADGELNVIEVNPRSSRTVPFISKVTMFLIFSIKNVSIFVI